jgi:sec-independent protein translocase protein TatC
MSEPGEPGELAEGTLISHLLELRDRLLKMMLAVGICFIPCAIYMNQLFTFVADPLIHKLAGGSDSDRHQRGGALHGAVQAGLGAGHWAGHPFLAVPGLGLRRARSVQAREKLAVPLLISSVLLFYLGAAFAYYVVFPVMLSFFVATTPHGVQMMTDMGSYLDFVMVLLLASVWPSKCPWLLYYWCGRGS